MKNKIETIYMGIFLIIMLAAPCVSVADNITVLKIDTLIMEKGKDTYSLTIKAFVKNEGESDDLTIDVVALDMNGYELHHATLSGFIPQGKTRVMVSVVKIKAEVYNEIVRWERKK